MFTFPGQNMVQVKQKKREMTESKEKMKRFSEKPQAEEIIFLLEKGFSLFYLQTNISYYIQLTLRFVLCTELCIYTRSQHSVHFLLFL